jgi:hypothetical protein
MADAAREHSQDVTSNRLVVDNIPTRFISIVANETSQFKLSLTSLTSSQMCPNSPGVAYPERCHRTE